MEKNIELLKRILVFSKLSEEQLKDIAKLEIRKEYKKGSVIFLKVKREMPFIIFYRVR